MKSLGTRLHLQLASIGFVLATLLPLTALSAHADVTSASGSANNFVSASKSNPDQLAESSTENTENIDELRQELQQQQLKLQQQQLQTQRLEERLEAIESDQKGDHGLLSSLKGKIAGHGAETTPAAANNYTDADIYNSGFYLKSKTGRFSLYINGLFQPRYTFFKPRGVSAFGSQNQAVSNFDIFLARVAFSGSVFDPNLKYFLQTQASTTGNGTNINLLDWFISKTFDPLLTVQMGRYWSAYTYEYYDSIGEYLFPDLSTVEYAFSLGRQIGLQLSGQEGKLGYNLAVANSIPGTDSSGVENLHGQMAYVGNLHYDILAPYGYQESDPSPEGATEPELTIWASGMYNPIEYSSVFENELPGDKTYGATTSINFRYKRFTFQGSGYYRRTVQHLSLPSYDSWAYQEQAGFYLIPGRWEIAERVGGLWWGAPEIPVSGGEETNWFSGPGNFPYHRMNEYSVGLNYYLYGHNAKIQTAYSYLPGSTFTTSSFSAQRFFLQGQIMF